MFVRNSHTLLKNSSAILKIPHVFFIFLTSWGRGWQLSDVPYVVMLHKQIQKLHQKQPLECYIKKVVLINFAKFTGKCLLRNLFLHKVAGLRPDCFIKRETPTKMCFCEIYEIFKKTFFVQYLRTTASVT